MTLLCFLLDLRSIPPSLLRDLKQSLLQLANLYVASLSRAERNRSGRGIPLLGDLIALCYIRNGGNSSFPSELKLAYRPGGNFSVRDFHHAVNNLPMDCFVSNLGEPMPTLSSHRDFPLEELLSDKALYSWVGECVAKKVIAIGSSAFTNTEALRKCLMDAAERCITVNFIVLEHEEANLFNNASDSTEGFINSINDLENCVFRRYLPDMQVLYGLVKGWLQELRNEVEEPLPAAFLFRTTILGSTNQISCNLFATCNQIIDGFGTCQTCRCHGYPLDIEVGNKTKGSSCPVTCNELRPSDLIENAVRVGEQTILFLPSFEGCPRLRQISAPIPFNVNERTNLASLNEGVILGMPYIVTPSACHDVEAPTDEYDKSELNVQLFHALRGALFSLDQGLVCSSTCNTDTMSDGTFQCFYILQPSDKGLMLLRKLASSEEILPIPDMGQPMGFVVSEEIENSIQASLSNIELRDYDPLQHERDIHSKLNWLVKESLQFGSTLPRQPESSPKVENSYVLQTTFHQNPSRAQAPIESMSGNQDKEDKISSCISEWEELLILDDMSEGYSTTCFSEAKHQNSITPTQTKALDEKTSRILERLEVPKQLKPKANSPSISSNLVCGQMKKPLLPLDLSSSQPLRPNFQRLKRKQW